jgi:hypothetical protein
MEWRSTCISTTIEPSVPIASAISGLSVSLKRTQSARNARSVAPPRMDRSLRHYDYLDLPLDEDGSLFEAISRGFDNDLWCDIEQYALSENEGL